MSNLESHATAANGNVLLAEMLNGLLEKCQVYVWMELTRLNDWQAVRDDHRAIVGAIAAGDAEAACQQTRRHIQESRDGILNLMLRQRGLRDLYKSRTGEK